MIIFTFDPKHPTKLDVKLNDSDFVTTVKIGNELKNSDTNGRIVNVCQKWLNELFSFMSLRDINYKIIVYSKGYPAHYCIYDNKELHKKSQRTGG